MKEVNIPALDAAAQCTMSAFRAQLKLTAMFRAAASIMTVPTAQKQEAIARLEAIAASKNHYNSEWDRIKAATTETVLQQPEE